MQAGTLEYHLWGKSFVKHKTKPNKQKLDVMALTCTVAHARTHTHGDGEDGHVGTLPSSLHSSLEAGGS